MHPAISYEMATARIADLRHQAQRDALARAVTHLSWSAPQPRRNPDSGQAPRLARPAASGMSDQGSSRGQFESRSGRIQRQFGEGMADNESRAAVISRQAVAGVPMTRHQPASGHRPGQQWPWIGAEEPR
jgi:hypothetical protein